MSIAGSHRLSSFYLGAYPAKHVLTRDLQASADGVGYGVGDIVGCIVGCNVGCAVGCAVGFGVGEYGIIYGLRDGVLVVASELASTIKLAIIL